MLLTLRREFLMAISMAVVIGLGIGAQAALVTRAGRQLGAIRASLSINFVAGSLAGLVLLSLIASRGVSQSNESTNVLRIVVISGVFNVISISGFAFVLQRLGVTATLTSIILGQMTAAVIIDRLGLAGGEPIPVDFIRLAGLIAMAIAVVLLIPRGSLTR